MKIEYKIIEKGHDQNFVKEELQSTGKSDENWWLQNSWNPIDYVVYRLAIGILGIWYCGSCWHRILLYKHVFRAIFATFSKWRISFVMAVNRVVYLIKTSILSQVIHPYISK